MKTALILSLLVCGLVVSMPRGAAAQNRLMGMEKLDVKLKTCVNAPETQAAAMVTCPCLLIHLQC